MAEEPEMKDTKNSIEIVFRNELSPLLYKQFLEGVISANLQEQIPAHLQRQLIDNFVEDGLMTP